MNSVDLEFVFAPFGVVSEAEIISNAKGSKGFGFVTFIRERDADQAKSLLHHTVIDGRVIEVNDALPRNKFRICPSPALLRFNMQERNQVLANLSARHTLVGPQSAGVQQQPLHRSAPIDVPEADSEWYRQVSQALRRELVDHKPHVSPFLVLQVRQALTQRVQHFSSSADLLTPVSSASPAGSPDSASPIMEYRLFR